MTTFTRRPTEVEAITFDELVEHGRANGANIVNGMPWSFEYNGWHVTHENDECYILGSPAGTLTMTPGNMLVSDENDELSILSKADFALGFAVVGI